MTASGTFGYGIEYADFMDISRLGGIFVKGTTIQPREGNDYPRMAEMSFRNVECRGDFRIKAPIISLSILSGDQGHQYEYDRKREWVFG